MPPVDAGAGARPRGGERESRRPRGDGEGDSDLSRRVSLWYSVVGTAPIHEYRSRPDWCRSRES